MTCEAKILGAGSTTTITGEVTGSFRPAGLTIGGRISSVSLDTTNWTPLPAIPLANRNALSIQNISGVEIKLQYDDTTVGYVGVAVGPSNERFYSISDSIVIYAKASSGSPSILVEELA